MNKIASYLQSHLSGEVFDSMKMREQFSTDASILTVTPSLVVYPRSTNDVRKVARFSWQLAEKGHILPITARGSGTDQTGAAIGKGIVLVFPAHLNRILELDSQQKLVRVQPGVNFQTLQETLFTHGLFIPAFPASFKYSTIGGAIANNTSGEKAFKYGSLVNWVDKLEVVLANGELIQTGRISRKEVEKKKGLTTMEGDLYRAVDGLLGENKEVISSYYDGLLVSKDSIGYSLDDVRRADGSIDLTPLFVGSQGTLGIITEAILKASPHETHTALVVASFDTLESAVKAVDIARDYEPSALEIIDRHLIEFAEKKQAYVFPETLVSQEMTPAAIIFIEFDDQSAKTRQRKAKKLQKDLKAVTDSIVLSEDFDEQDKLWALRYSAATVVNHDEAGKVALPIIEDAAVPREKLLDFFGVIYDLFERHHIEPAVWGHAGDANLHVLPLMDLNKLGDRQKIFKLMDEYFRAVIDMGGTMAGEHNDGRLRVPFVKLQTGEEIFTLFTGVKAAFDPFGTLNPGVKLGTDVKQLVEMLRKEYSLAHLAHHLPRT